MRATVEYTYMPFSLFQLAHLNETFVKAKTKKNNRNSRFSLLPSFSFRESFFLCLVFCLLAFGLPTVRSAAAIRLSFLLHFPPFPFPLFPFFFLCFALLCFALLGLAWLGLASFFFLLLCFFALSPSLLSPFLPRLPPHDLLKD